MKHGYVYILSNKQQGVIYIGVTSNLIQRVWQHKNELAKGFSQKYQLKRLVYFERHETIIDAIEREKQMKKWNRQWKLELIEKENPDWLDLYDSLL